MRSFLRLLILAALGVGAAPAEEIAGLPGISEELARAIVAYREKNGPFARPQKVQDVPGVTREIWEEIEERVRALPPVGATPEGEGAAATPARPGLVAVANFFTRFEGIDLDALPPDIRGAFVGRVNRETCPCGCAGDTIARCYVNDPGCAVARARLRTLYRQAAEGTLPSGDE